MVCVIVNIRNTVMCIGLHELEEKERDTSDIWCLIFFSISGGPGLYDPCEKEAYDVTATLTNQQREDITALAQVLT